VDASSAGVSPFGCCDLFGNVDGNDDHPAGVTDGGTKIALAALFCGAPGVCNVSSTSVSPCIPANGP
jgi:hypothetical protein